ncbi:cytochrome b2 [Ilyonectria robusta]|uniref:cytochrome b2 n=1 Tax=Ilyonectria robusta TaxID=1079257 RepID=UPI001E8D3E4B|nr:cytochrome b2 [Ilyonectria robusta]KAH8722229.1 cytochrome b2 [Ilyonectria robusta]
MWISGPVIVFATCTLAARPFLNEPDTGLNDFLGDFAVGSLPDLDSIAGLPDFEWAARNFLPLQNYTYFRNAAGGEWSYRNNLEAFQRYSLLPRRMMDVRNVKATLPTTILGHKFSSPFFISPAARQDMAHPDAELNLVRAAGESNILYVPSLKASKSIEEIAAARAAGQVTFQQLYLPNSDKTTRKLVKQIEDSGAAAIVLTVDAPVSGDRQRAFRLRGGPPEPDYTLLTWERYHNLTAMTSLPIVLKGILTVSDAQDAVKNGVKAIMLSNHGARQLDGSPSSLEVALEIRQKAPEIFSQLEVYADGGVRYGTDILKLLALGVRAVGLGRPFVYANVFGIEGVRHAIDLLNREVTVDAANLGVTNLHEINASYVQWTQNTWIP